MFKQIFAELSKATDIFNLGRFVFYTAAGVLVVLPLNMILSLLSTLPDNLATGLFLQLSNDFGGTLAESRAWILLFCSIIIGFVIAAAGFTIVIQDEKVSQWANEKLAETLKRADPAKSFSFNYPKLRNDNANADYSAWLVTEYYRYLEIVVFIPIGAILGVTVITLYVSVFIIKQTAVSAGAGFTEAHLSFILLLSLLLLIKYYLWPEFWLKRVVAPVLAAYRGARTRLIEGLQCKSTAP